MLTVSCQLNIFADIATIVSTILSFATLGLAIWGVKCVYNIREHQHEAAYGFYANIQTYFEMLKLFILEGDKMSAWMILLGKNKAEINNMNKQGYVDDAENCSVIAKEFLTFLAKANNQVPPSNEKKKEWDISFDVLRKDLVKIAYYDLAGYIDWREDKISETFTSLINAITEISQQINDYKEANA